ncbi:MAG: CHRD domain-containing protein [Armatimonadetes bacterium]|nr:CHRD domain-containing protein [Armatimonadota bacterium]
MRKTSLTCLAVIAFGASAQAALYGFAAPVINGAQQVPSNNSAGYGSGSFTMDTATFVISGSLTLINVPYPSLTAFHIHLAPAGANGPVIAPLDVMQIAGSPLIAGNMVVIAFRGPLTPAAQNAATVNAMIAGGSYFNFHTAQFPGGMIRGQIDCTGPVPEPTSFAALGTAGLLLLARRRRA